MIRKSVHQVAGIRNAYAFKNRRKVFCIGRNKTGTTSMEALFKELGLPVGPQRPAELLAKDWTNNDFSKLIRFVKYKGVAFQDVPFSLPGTYEVLDQAFHDSKFILTVRDSPETWYRSLTTSHARLFGNGNIPTKADLQNADYVYKGWMWEMNRAIYDTPEDDIYNESILKKHYSDYNNSVIDYFKNKPGKLLVVNLKDKKAGDKIANFLAINKKINQIPWKNKTVEIG